jgi:hypothetical protein
MPELLQVPDYGTRTFNAAGTAEISTGNGQT